MASVAVTAPEDMGFLAGLGPSTVAFVNGFCQSPGSPPSAAVNLDNSISYYMGATIATPVTGLRLGTAFDLLDVYNQSGETWAASVYASFQAARNSASIFVVSISRTVASKKTLTAMASDKTMAYHRHRSIRPLEECISRLEMRLGSFPQWY